MVIVKIIGGMASQLHKYAVGRAMSLKYSMPLFLDLSWFESTPESATPRQFRLNIFPTHYEITKNDLIELLTGSRHLLRVKNSLLNQYGINLQLSRADFRINGISALVRTDIYRSVKRHDDYVDDLPV